MLRHLSLLQDLSLRGCQQLSDGALPHLAGLAQLSRLDLRACEHLRGTGLTHLAGLRRLRALNLKGCYSLGDEGLEAVGGLRGLEALSLQECWQATDRGLRHLAGKRLGRSALFPEGLPRHVFMGRLRTGRTNLCLPFFHPTCRPDAPGRFEPARHPQPGQRPRRRPGGPARAAPPHLPLPARLRPADRWAGSCTVLKPVPDTQPHAELSIENPSPSPACPQTARWASSPP